ncbi:peroxidasin [Orussus abietinus]|uniref:peroxidasin n=1 Tax=Orussus abietinus TaxID=222816 RepID=UPI0006266545|nr:peroxidasin [Orussus abietinus]XP_012286671.1 peroxidasin [Orussus abietinus]XP_012286672.1 peroxidasin [Orussus abietinus]XP_012286673.1 peroxidasin [Orussus abietinus]XP_012286674.1 peroxidasin [Orussus abietinus]XP_012286675.1 peroxidasin [Orussus abietinus]XP_012286676.1 peroxidasin [Orussus abietinus]
MATENTHKMSRKTCPWPGLLPFLIIMLLIAIIMNASTTSGTSTTIRDCPRKCMCFLSTVRCMLQKISRVPRVPDNTTVLDLRFNDIAEIRVGAFYELKDLHTLLLNDNHLKYLQADAFIGAPSIRILYLYKNRIERIAPGAFRNLPKLEQLYLQNNHLTRIETGTFNDLPALERLFLQNNKLNRVPADAFRNVGPMTKLKLDSNALVCDCDLVWLLQRARTRPSEMAAICHEPTYMKGKSLAAMSVNDFHCTKPKIMEGPADVEVHLGETATLSCRVAGDPKPSIKWMRNSDEVPLDGEHYVMKDDGSLTISPMTENDVGEYECVASSEMGYTKSRPARAVVTVSPNIRFTEVPHSRTIKTGDDVTLICRAEGTPSPRLSWWRDGERIETGGRTFVEDSATALRILATKDSDSGRYVCQAENENGLAEASADLRVLSQDPSLDPQDLIRFTNVPLSQSVRPGEDVTLICTAEGRPPPRLSWWRNGERVREGGRTFVENSGTSLKILAAKESDSARYVCQGENENDIAEAAADLKVGSEGTSSQRVVQDPIRFTNVPLSQSVQSGEDVTLICTAEGLPPPRLSWWRNGERVQQGGRIFLEDAGTTLKILAAKESDSARYVCQAKSDDGFVEASADLRILNQGTSSPRLTYEPQDMEVEPGASVEVPCRAEGLPKPSISWKKDGTAVSGNRFKVTRGGSLFLLNLSAADSGRYECSAVNEHGRATSQALIRVRQGERTDALIVRAFQDASESVDRAINKTLVALFSSAERVNPFRLTRFPDAVGRAAARPAEVYERTLANLRRLVDSGIAVNGSNEFRYEDILTQEQIREIEKLSGCTGHRSRNDCSNVCFHKKYRTIDGTCNNLGHPTWGASYTGFRRVLKPLYENGFSQPIGWDRSRRYFGFRKPAARLVSTTMIATQEITSDEQITHMVMQWGQFLDHDLDHALPSVSSESWDGIDCKKSCDNAAPCFPMEVPPGDPRVTNRRCIDFIRTSAVCGSGMTSVLWGLVTPREQLNQLTSYLDASQVYGYDDELARRLRDLASSRGLLRVGPTFPGRKPLLPFASGEFVDCRRDPLESSVSCFVAGDIRANEQVGLLAMHTLFLREHNRLAERLFEVNPHWDGETLYQEARRIVGAQMQHVTFRHWMPRVFGEEVEDLLGPYSGYDPDLDASISNVFATAALRFGHSLIQPELQRLDWSFQSIRQGPLRLRDAFFSPWRLVDEGGVDPLLRGMFATPAKLKLPEQNLNTELTEQLFRIAHAVALDLAAMNIQRGRDHGIPGYLDWREHCNMSRVETFEDLRWEITSPKVRQKLKELYGHPGNVDVWVGGILEDQLPGAKVGPLFKCLLLEQFRRLRDGDRFWYEGEAGFKDEQLQEIRKTSLARLLCDNGDNITRVQPDVFVMPGEGGGFVSCEDIPKMDLRVWADCCESCPLRSNGISRSRRSVEYSQEENCGNLTLTIAEMQGKLEELRKIVNKMLRSSEKLL